MNALSRSGVGAERTDAEPKFARRFSTFSILLAMLAAATSLAPPAALAARRHRARAAAEAAPAASSKNEPQGPYSEACVLEPATGTVIFEVNDHQPWPTASLAKMMLMLIVAEKIHDGSLKLSDQVTTSRKAATMGGSQVYLKEGETFSLDDMMKAVVVHSANDATTAVAEYLAGSTDSFVVMMNAKAASLGLKDTHYYNVHGLPPEPGESPDVASAYDQAMLAREMLKYPDVLRWSSIDTAPFRGGSFVLRNTNHMVRTYPGCDGLKTGFYNEAGFNVVATAKRGGLRLIAVVLGTPRVNLTNFRQASELLSQGFLNYEMHPIAKRGSPVAQTVAVTGAETESIKPIWASDAGVFVKRGEAKSVLKVDYSLPASVAAPIKAGQQIGTAQVTESGKPVATIALLAPAEIPKKGSIVKRLFSFF
jgi:serine-type D-Ala-D-Ala carboxypeptidase (penicillin-binding protein 5/6)